MLYLCVEFVRHGMSGRDIVFVTVPGKDLDLWFWPCHMIGGEKRLSNAVETEETRRK